MQRGNNFFIGPRKGGETIAESIERPTVMERSKQKKEELKIWLKERRKRKRRRIRTHPDEKRTLSEKTIIHEPCLVKRKKKCL